MRAIDEIAVDAQPIDIDDERRVRPVSGQTGEGLLDAHARNELDRKCTGGGPAL